MSVFADRVATLDLITPFDRKRERWYLEMTYMAVMKTSLFSQLMGVQEKMRCLLWPSVAR